MFYFGESDNWVSPEHVDDIARHCTRATILRCTEASWHVQGTCIARSMHGHIALIE